MQALYWFSSFLAAVCLVASLLPFFRHAHGACRVFDFPRVQVFALSLIGILIAVTFLRDQAWLALMIGAFLASMAIQAFFIARFTPVWPVSVPSASNVKNCDSVNLSLFVCNVRQSNQEYTKVSRLVELHDPDIAVFMETDQAWVDGLEELLQKYEHKILCARDNSYGMILVSRLPLKESKIRFLMKGEVPSFHCELDVANTIVRFISVHPEPPIPTEDTVGRDAEISKVGLMVRGEDRPTIVTGDLNDVAWSPTSRRFLRGSGLRDPREGRGLFSSFHADYWYLRWPLDHLFLSRHFDISKICRLDNIGSDHFPMPFTLALNSQNLHSATPPSADSEELQEMEDLMGEERQRDDGPIGEDWEK